MSSYDYTPLNRAVAERLGWKPYVCTNDFVQQPQKHDWESPDGWTRRGLPDFHRDHSLILRLMCEHKLWPCSEYGGVKLSPIGVWVQGGNQPACVERYADHALPTDALACAVLRAWLAVTEKKG